MNVAAALVLAVAGCAMPAEAQRATETDTGSHIAVPRRARIAEAAGSAHERGRAVMAQFARCSLDRSPARVAAVLRDPIGEDYHRKIVGISTSECLAAGEMRFQPILMRGALFTEMWQRRVLAERSGRAWAPVLPAFDEGSAPAPDSTTEARRNYMLQWFGNCVAARARAATSTYVLASDGAARAQAYVALTPQLGPCWISGEPLRMNHTVLTGVLAEALYRLPAVALTEAKN